MKLRIGIIGTRGIPNHYGGFECFAENVAPLLATRGHEVYVYNSHNHPYRENTYKGVHIIHCYDPEYLLGTTGQFIYDLNCIRNARNQSFDVLLFLGYTSSSIWGAWYPEGPVIIYNMDGLEWMRSKYGPYTRKYLHYAEKLAIRYSDYFVADSPWIKDYLKDKYDVNATFIAYGATVITKIDEQVLTQYQLRRFEYNMLMARMEPENNIEMVLEGYQLSETTFNFLVVGSTANKFGTYLRKKFSHDRRIIFAEAIYDKFQISSLIYYSNLYFHGHSVGGTNPSLLEAMANQGLIVAWNNPFNNAVLQRNGFYFQSASDIARYASTLTKGPDNLSLRLANTEKIEQEYNWNKISESYERMFFKCLRGRKPYRHPAFRTTHATR